MGVLHPEMVCCVSFFQPLFAHLFYSRAEHLNTLVKSVDRLYAISCGNVKKERLQEQANIDDSSHLIYKTSL